jgi:hypothetical protein
VQRKSLLLIKYRHKLTIPSAVSASIARAVIYSNAELADDAPFATAKLAIATGLESMFAIICASLFTIGPLYKHWRYRGQRTDDSASNDMSHPSQKYYNEYSYHEGESNTHINTAGAAVAMGDDSFSGKESRDVSITTHDIEMQPARM